jgi:MFS family permease
MMVAATAGTVSGNGSTSSDNKNNGSTTANDNLVIHEENEENDDDKASEMQPLTNDGHEKLLARDGLIRDGDDGRKILAFETEYGIADDGSALDSLGSSSSTEWNLHDWLYPPQLPRSCQLLRRENIAIPACYLLVGILQGLSGPLINVYPLEIGATEAQQTTLSSIKSLPASFKLVFGFISDNFPIVGYRRKSYMSIGWGLAAASMMALILTRDLTIVEEEYIKDDGSTATRSIAPENAPSVPFLSLCMLLFGTGFWMADVMGDSVVAEKAKLEPEHVRGSTQSSCYSYRFFGLMCAAPFSTGLYKWAGPYYVFCLLAVFPLSILPLVYGLGEVRDAPVASTKQQCNEIWNTVCSRSVWQPLAFVYAYNVLQVGNAAWREYLKTVLGFTSLQLNMIYIASVVLLYLGVITYKYYIINWSWRLVYVVTTLLNGFFSMLQVLLILGITFGMSPFLFALGDDAFTEFIQGIQFLPTTIMMVHLCPAGSEGKF